MTWRFKGVPAAGMTRGTIIVKGEFRIVTYPRWDKSDEALALDATIHDVLGIGLREAARRLGMKASELSGLLSGSAVFEDPAEWGAAQRMLRGGE